MSDRTYDMKCMDCGNTEALKVAEGEPLIWHCVTCQEVTEWEYATPNPSGSAAVKPAQKHDLSNIKIIRNHPSPTGETCASCGRIIDPSDHGSHCASCAVIWMERRCKAESDLLAAEEKISDLKSQNSDLEAGRAAVAKQLTEANGKIESVNAVLRVVQKRADDATERAGANSREHDRLALELGRKNAECEKLTGELEAASEKRTHILQELHATRVKAAGLKGVDDLLKATTEQRDAAQERVKDSAAQLRTVRKWMAEHARSVAGVGGKIEELRVLLLWADAPKSTRPIIIEADQQIPYRLPVAPYQCAPLEALTVRMKDLEDVAHTPNNPEGLTMTPGRCAPLLECIRLTREHAHHLNIVAGANAHMRKRITKNEALLSGLAPVVRSIREVIADTAARVGKLEKLADAVTDLYTAVTGKESVLSMALTSRALGPQP